MVVFVTGASGQLGQALQSIAAQFPDLVFRFTNSAVCDITDRVSVQHQFEMLRPDFCINAAAYTAVDKAESEPDKARLINVIGAQNLALACAAFNCKLIHISTDFVFDGLKTRPYLETDVTNPQSVYGASKRDGELAIATVLRQHFIVRTSWVYSDFGNNFKKTMLRLARERKSVSVVNDQIGTPTHALVLARALLAIIYSKSKAFGIYHFSGEGQTSWYGFAKEIFFHAGIEIELNPIPTESFPTPARRPAYSVLDKSKFKSTFDYEIQDWTAALNQKH